MHLTIACGWCACSGRTDLFSDVRRLRVGLRTSGALAACYCLSWGCIHAVDRLTVGCPKQVSSRHLVVPCLEIQCLEKWWFQAWCSSPAYEILAWAEVHTDESKEACLNWQHLAEQAVFLKAVCRDVLVSTDKLTEPVKAALHVLDLRMQQWFRKRRPRLD